MKKSFKFNYFGLSIIFRSNNELFSKILKNKFDQFKKNKTFQFESRNIDIVFKDVQYIPKYIDLKIVSSKAFKEENKLFLKHDYLTTQSLIITKFYESDITTIEILFKSSVAFKILNFFTKNLLKRQLFQNIIKLYIEHSLLWNLSAKHSLRCLHASAVEKNGAATIFCGLNGVGKSTLSLFLTKKQRFNLFGDNYILIDKENAYFSPDSLRFNKNSLSLLGLKPVARFGFGKYSVDNNKIKFSGLKVAKIKKILFVTRGNNWSLNKTSKSIMTKTVENLQIINFEEPRFSPASQFFSGMSFKKPSMPVCDYSFLNLGNLAELEYEF